MEKWVFKLTLIYLLDIKFYKDGYLFIFLRHLNYYLKLVSTNLYFVTIVVAYIIPKVYFLHDL